MYGVAECRSGSLGVARGRSGSLGVPRGPGSRGPPRIGGVHFGNSHWPQSSQPQPRSGQPAEQPTNRQQVSTASVKAPNSAQRRSKERRQTFLEKKGSQDGRAAFSPTPPGPEPGEPSEVDTTKRDADGKEPVASGGQRGQKRATGETPASNLQPKAKQSPQPQQQRHAVDTTAQPATAKEEAMQALMLLKQAVKTSRSASDRRGEEGRRRPATRPPPGPGS